MSSPIGDAYEGPLSISKASYEHKSTIQSICLASCENDVATRANFKIRMSQDHFQGL